MIRQFPLFGSVNLPICPACKRETAVLGQWSPGERLYVCRDCMTSYAPPDVFVHHDNRIGAGLRQGRAYTEQREQYHARAAVLDELMRGCIYTVEDIGDDDYLPCMRENDIYTIAVYGGGGRGWKRPIDASGCRMDCPRCQDRLRRVIRQRENMLHFVARMKAATTYTANLPICARCGAVHDHRTHDGEAAQFCQHCTDLHAVESFWNQRGIFGGDDDETVLDRIQQSHPDLFERGVLPDQWFLLKAGVNR